ncbi:hypothetical protein ACFXPX_38340 [Kitasatospora sp. NPDC059146]|uniref:hypothetical protein n=1 Tax=unclassified Kitasatospora TaxID=2633591 RepID=UPI0035DD237A
MATPTEPDYNHTLSVKHDDLKYFADTELGAFLKDLAGNPGYRAMLSFAGEGGGDYSTLLLGHGSPAALSIATKIQTDFKTLAGGISTDLKTMGTQMTEGQLRIRLALTLMEAAHEEAMTAADMMAILGKVSSATPPKTSTSS